MTSKLDINIISSYNTHILNVADVSEYPVGNAISNPYIEITPPGFQKVTLIFSPKTINVYNSTSLKLSEGDYTGPLPDGIYKFRYSVQPNYDNFVDKSFFKIDQIVEKYDAAVLKLDSCNFSKDKVLRDKLDEIEYFMQFSMAAANKCNDKLAIELYTMALNLLKQLNC